MQFLLESVLHNMGIIWILEENISCVIVVNYLNCIRPTKPINVTKLLALPKNSHPPVRQWQNKITKGPLSKAFLMINMKNNNTLNILQCQKFVKQKEQIETFLNVKKPDLFLVSEHGLNNNDMELIQIENYKLLNYYSRGILNYWRCCNLCKQ